MKKWFSFEHKSPYMMYTAEIADTIKNKTTDEEEKLQGIEKLKVKRSLVPAVTHVDYSARIQTVDGEINKKYFHLLKKLIPFKIIFILFF